MAAGRSLDAKDEKIADQANVCHCDLIYQAAKNPNKAEARLTIQKILTAVTIDVYHKVESHTAASKLAAEGDIESVEFLRKEFNAGPRWIGAGYALGGYVNEANKILALATNPIQKHLICQLLITNYIAGKFSAEADKLLSQATTPYETQSLLVQKATGYCCINEPKAANEILKSIAPTHRISLLSNMGFIYARTRNELEIENISAEAKTRDEQLQLLNNIAGGYARIGCEIEANKVLRKAQNQVERLSILGFILYYYAVGGYFEKIEELLATTKTSESERLKLFQEIAWGSGIGGYLAKGTQLLAENSTPLNKFNLLVPLVRGYSKTHQHIHANDLLKQANSPEQRLKLLEIMAEHFTNVGDIAESNKLLLQADHKTQCALSKRIAVALDHPYVKPTLPILSLFNPSFQRMIASELKDSKEALKLVPQTTKLHNVMKIRKLNFNQAMIWIQPEMQIWLMQGVQLVREGKLLAPLFLSISTYLTSSTLPEMLRVSNVLLFATCPDRLISSSRLLSADCPPAPTNKNPALQL